MNEVIRDVDVLKNAIIAFAEGASDEKRMAINSLTKLVEEKETLIKEYDEWVDQQAAMSEGMYV
jgi:hypothetical protein